MRFAMLVKSTPKSETGVMPDEKMLSEMGAYNDALIKAGAMLAGEGLAASSKGARARWTNGQVKVIDGPFAESKELVSGFWVIQVKSRDEAIAWAKRVPFEEGEIEIRALYEVDDFPIDPSEQPDGWRDQEQRIRDEQQPITTSTPAPSSAPRDGKRRFMAMLKSDHASESGALPAPEGLAEMGALMEEAIKSGTVTAGEGLKPSASGARVRFAGAQRSLIDGPFTESKEMIAGYCIVRAKSLAEAVEWSKRWLEIHARHAGVAQSEIEVRQVHELEDFPVDPTEKRGGWREQEQRFREQSGQT